MNADEARAATTCDHTERIAVRYTDTGGRAGVRLQCQRCGQSGQNVKASGYSIDALPPYDQTLVDQWDDYRRTVWDSVAADYQAEREAQRIEWFAGYSIYLQSPHWESVRRRVIHRDQFVCQLCERRVEVHTAHVHHLSYDTYRLIGQSLPAECVTLCRACHERIEAAKQTT